MTEETTENETPKNEGEQTPETEGEESPQEENPEGEQPEKSKELQSALAQKDHWRKKAETAEGLLKSKPPESAPKESKEGDSKWRDKVNFLLQEQTKNYSEEEFDHIAIVSSQKSISLDEAAKQEDEYIQFKREKVADKKKIPGSSPSEFSSKVQKSPEDLKKMLEEGDKGGGMTKEAREKHREYFEKMKRDEESQA